MMPSQHLCTHLPPPHPKNSNVVYMHVHTTPTTKQLQQQKQHVLPVQGHVHKVSRCCDSDVHDDETRNARDSLGLASFHTGRSNA